jgi:tRNA A58 N-methylase Trm61
VILAFLGKRESKKSIEKGIGSTALTEFFSQFLQEI